MRQNTLSVLIHGCFCGFGIKNQYSILFRKFLEGMTVRVLCTGWTDFLHRAYSRSSVFLYSGGARAPTPPTWINSVGGMEVEIWKCGSAEVRKCGSAEVQGLIRVGGVGAECLHGVWGQNASTGVWGHPKGASTWSLNYCQYLINNGITPRNRWMWIYRE